MRISRTVALTVLTTVILLLDAAGNPPDTADIDSKLTAMAAYKRGDARRALIEVEKLIRLSEPDAERRRYIERGLARLLESDVTNECREFICSQLWIIGTAESVPSIAKLLTDEKTVDMACYAIGRNPSPAAAKALRQALTKTEPAARIRIIDLLGDRKDAQSVDALGKIAFEQNPELAVAAIAALGKIGGPEATELLRRARAKPNRDLQVAATDAYLRCAEDLASTGKNEEAVTIYRELVDANEPAFIRAAAVKGLADIGGVDLAGIVLEALRDPSRTVRATARGCIRTMKGDRVTQLFAAELPKSSPADQVLILAALADRGDVAALPAVRKAAQTARTDVRLAAIQAIGKLGGAPDVKLLVDAATGAASTGQRNVAIRSLTVLRGEKIDAEIIKNMQRTQTLRVQLIHVLGDRNAVDAVRPLLAEAANEDAKTRTAAFKALGRLARPDDLPALISLLADIKGAAGRKEAERAVLAVARKIPDVNDRADPILARFNNDQDTRTRSSFLRVLGAIPNQKALDTIAANLNDPDTSLRDTAVRMTAQWPDTRALPHLVNVFRTTQNNVHRILALRALIRIPAETGPAFPTIRALALHQALWYLARNTQEKKLVISGLSNIGHPHALEIVIAGLTDEPVREEAALAAVKIAQKILPDNPHHAAEAARKVLNVTTSDTLRKAAEEILASTRKTKKDNDPPAGIRNKSGQ